MQLLDSSEYSDFTIHCANEVRIPAHRLILMARCPALKKVRVNIYSLQKWCGCKRGNWEKKSFVLKIIFEISPRIFMFCNLIWLFYLVNKYLFKCNTEYTKTTSMDFLLYLFVILTLNSYFIFSYVAMLNGWKLCAKTFSIFWAEP